MDDILRGLPQVQRLLEHEEAARLQAAFGRAALIEAIRQSLDELRRQIRERECLTLPTAAVVLQRVAAILAGKQRGRLRRTINATGIALHTNLGRAPLAAEAVAAMAEVGGHYSNLEYDLDTGERGSRTAGLEALLQEITGAEAALAVNNGAAAILLALAALGGGGEVIVSRGELVEIGGGFRIPDVIRQGGATLVEVGATNRTRPADYFEAMSERTRVLLKVHQSNYRMIGFTAETSIAELAAVARPSGAMVVADLGSGLLQTTKGFLEPTLREALESGADLVTCSGDKLLGGPQAGLILGSATAVRPLRKHPLLRALRLDKLSLAALEATLMLHRDAPDRVPIRRILLQDGPTIRERAMRLIQLLGKGELIESVAFAGGGALPGQQMTSFAVTLDPVGGPAAATRALRGGRPPIITRVSNDRLLVDLLAVSDEEIETLAAGLVEI